jgi:hypothetical protein
MSKRVSNLKKLRGSILLLLRSVQTFGDVSLRVPIRQGYDEQRGGGAA